MTKPNLTRAAPAAEGALADRLRPVLLRLSRQLRRESHHFGVSPLDVSLLVAIEKRPGIGVSGLAELEQTTRPTMSAHVKRLEAQGWVRREVSGVDRRRAGLALAPAGTRALEAVRRRRTSWLTERLGRLSPEERTALSGAIGALAKLAGEPA